MKQLFVLCLIHRDAVETVHRDAATTEIPVLQAIYGDALAVTEGSAFVAERDVVTPAEEYERLVRRYGKDAVTAAYGAQYQAEQAIAGMFKDGEKQATAAVEAGAEVKNATTPDPLLEGTVEAIVGQIPELEDGHLAALLTSEQAGKNRKGVVSALQAEIQARADEDAGK